MSMTVYGDLTHQNNNLQYFYYFTCFSKLIQAKQSIYLHYWHNYYNAQ